MKPVQTAVGLGFFVLAMVLAFAGFAFRLPALEGGVTPYVVLVLAVVGGALLLASRDVVPEGGPRNSAPFVLGLAFVGVIALAATAWLGQPSSRPTAVSASAETEK